MPHTFVVLANNIYVHSIPLLSINRIRQPKPHSIVVDTKTFQTYNFTFDQDPGVVSSFLKLFTTRMHVDFYNDPSKLYAFRCVGLHVYVRVRVRGRFNSTSYVCGGCCSFEQQMATMRDRAVNGGGGAPKSSRTSTNPAKAEWVRRAQHLRDSRQDPTLTSAFHTVLNTQVYKIGAEFRRQGALHSKSCWQVSIARTRQHAVVILLRHRPCKA